eukprot:gb/GEZN01001457.1/.p1 GENE.gb/GEZN01001457.1/~~gb/GEZN01001457.1/.p1  ORF type:complete len:830 (-),score=128.25 gb/GEZN01001457.1/:495-2984(-)
MLRSARLRAGRGRQHLSVHRALQPWETAKLHTLATPFLRRAATSPLGPAASAQHPLQRPLRHFSAAPMSLQELPLLSSVQKQHIILMGPPGSGKTTIAKLLSRRLGWNTLDVDNDILETVWGAPVSQRLKELGDVVFQGAEGQAIQEFALQLQQGTHPGVSGSMILSLSGSNPLDRESFNMLAQSGVVLFLDAPPGDILRRLEYMKVNRIIGQATMSMSEILDYRRAFYELYYDARILIGSGDSAETIAEEVFRVLTRPQHYLSTRGAGKGQKPSDSTNTFRSVLSEGLAPDRGLYIPASLLDAFSSTTRAPGYREAHMARLARLVPLPYSERVLRLLEQLPLGDLNPSTGLRPMLQKAYGGENFLGAQAGLPPKSDDQPVEPDVLPLYHLEGHHYLLELFQGPTASFKDLALQLTPQLIQYAQKQIDPEGKKMAAILVATSGDTGTAALDGFAKHTSFPMIVLYPKGGVSSIQELQMLTAIPAEQIIVLGVDGDFDKCQALVKGIFNDRKYQDDLNKKFMARRRSGSTGPENVLLTSANSINWGRMLPQIPFVVSGYLDLVKRGVVKKLGDPIDICVPTGNYGNILSVIIAQALFQIPLRKVICASNSNNVLFDFFKSGQYDISKREFHKTVSPAIDILVSSNLERFLWLLTEGDDKQVKEWMSALESPARAFNIGPDLTNKLRDRVVAGWCDEDACLRTMRETLQRTKVMLDPHTAVAKKVADEVSPVTGDASVPLLIFSTAHFGKFPESLCSAVCETPCPRCSSKEPMTGPEQVTAIVHRRKPANLEHRKLQALGNLPIIHTKTCSGDPDELRQIISEFLLKFQTK